ncbi:transcriptional regulator, LysR family [Kribbella flavida DSM 17836]|uniref:Transcriptional regulator, LysR family n=1 Tax=Kribbella flavida (strain DSM 17836 / JCM 10339 / NBRC 14399) TaxID=479435 RepID=D2PZW6_KRIFD|nr:LysR family transcriptional regulator [Kribbella flavida]ADB29964.1 transcriptional regulator, LysR family [Kribbella flavida DSM 17836]
MELTPLRAFREVCRLGSISAAAEHLGYTQSAVSRQLTTLESQLGRDLLTRHARGVVPTAAGEILLTHAIGILAQVDRAAADVAAAESWPGPLRVGAVPTASARLLPQALNVFHRVRPDARVTFAEGVTPDLVPRLVDGTIDLAVVTDQGVSPDSAPLRAGARCGSSVCGRRGLDAEHRGLGSRAARCPAECRAVGGESGDTPYPPGLPAADGLDLVKLLDDHLHVALPADHRLASEQRIDLTDLAKDSWVEDYPGAAAVLTGLCARAGFVPRIDIECGSLLGKQAFVAAGYGVMLVPGLVVPALRPDVVVRELTGSPTRTVYVATRAGDAPCGAVDGFLDALQASA